MNYAIKTVQIATVIVFSSTLVTPASAISCNGRYQIVSGSEISTPYCEDNYLGKVARSYGISVSNRAIRRNPNLKQEVCRTVGHDNRVSGICNDSGHDRKRKWH